jgi:GT2 family glycosyltransferase
LNDAAPSVTIVIPTYRREQVLLETLTRLLALPAPAEEILVVDQTERHDADTERVLQEHATAKRVRWLRLPQPSIPRAMNTGLREALGDVVLYLDDDVIPSPSLVAAHRRAHSAKRGHLIAGQVIQPWDEPSASARSPGPFAGSEPESRSEFMGGNFSIGRARAVELGGFDENFVHVGYRFEAEFASRLRRIGGSIWFEPEASVRHRKSPTGGTRVYGDHLRTVRPSHAVGAYYFALRARPRGWWLQMLARPWRSICTRHHLKRPWWIPVTLLAEGMGFLWALGLFLRGPRLIETTSERASHPEPRATR